MPGAFVISDGQVVRAHLHAGPADRPDYLRFVDEANVELERSGARQPKGPTLR